MTIVIATNNQYKVKEFQAMLDMPNVTCVSMKDLGITLDVVEDGNEFWENAVKKATALYQLIDDDSYIVIADDSGLCVDALDGAPGVYSARYSGGDDKENNRKLLEELEGVPDEERTAYFACAIAMVRKGSIEIFKGECHGTIAHKEIGENRFGYDPIFIHQGDTRTFGEVPAEEKNKISHRAEAIKKLKAYLLENI
jgi:XTP/dITP diphosphohydrolase